MGLDRHRNEGTYNCGHPVFSDLPNAYKFACRFADLQICIFAESQISTFVDTQINRFVHLI